MSPQTPRLSHHASHFAPPLPLLLCCRAVTWLSNNAERSLKLFYYRNKSVSLSFMNVHELPLQVRSISMGTGDTGPVFTWYYKFCSITHWYYFCSREVKKKWFLCNQSSRRWPWILHTIIAFLRGNLCPVSIGLVFIVITYRVLSWSYVLWMMSAAYDRVYILSLLEPHMEISSPVLSQTQTSVCFFAANNECESTLLFIKQNQLNWI